MLVNIDNKYFEKDIVLTQFEAKRLKLFFYLLIDQSFFHSFDLNHLGKAAFQWHRICSLQTLILVESGFITNPLTPLMDWDIEKV